MYRYLCILTFLALATGWKNRILFGDSVHIHNYPYQVSLQYSNRHHCGGAIISSEWIITGAHCIETDRGQLYRVRAGTSFSKRGGSVHRVDRTIVHESYRRNKDNGLVNDVALVHLADPLVIDDTRRPIELFKRNQVAARGSLATVTGWGNTLTEITADQLQMMRAPIIDRTTCSKAYSKVLDEPPSEGRICAGYFGVGGKDACKGDSGGPLVIDGRLAGIISYGTSCAANNKIPGVYAEVAVFRDWIKKHSGV